MESSFERSSLHDKDIAAVVECHGSAYIKSLHARYDPQQLEVVTTQDSKGGYSFSSPIHARVSLLPRS